MKNPRFYALIVVAGAAAALALNLSPRADTETASQGAPEALRVPVPSSSDNLTVFSGIATETVVFSDEEGALIEVAAAQYRASSTTSTVATSASNSGPASTTTTVANPGTTTTTKPPATTTTTAASGGPNSSYESDFYSRINSFRKSNGLVPLTRNGSLDSRARSWAEHLADIGKLQHSSLSSLIPPWTAAGENVGAGYSVSGLFDAFKSSSYHRGVMLGDFTHIGVGVWVDADGTIWTVHVFAHD